MKPRSRTLRKILLAIAIVETATWWSIAALASGTGKSFTSLAPGFTQDLYGVTGDFVDDSGMGILGGVAFSPTGDVWSAECYFYGTRLHRFAHDVTELQNGTSVHHDNVVDISEIGPYGAVLPEGAGGCGLVNHPDGFIYANSQSGIWKLNAETGLPVDPATGQPIDPNTPVADWHAYLVGGASSGPGNALGLAVDPKFWGGDPTHHIVYPGDDCHPSLNPGSPVCTLWDLNPQTRVTRVFARIDRPAQAFIDGLYFAPSGDYLFAAWRDENTTNPQNALYIFRRPAALGAVNATVDNAQVVTKVAMASEPDGVAFHAQQGFVVTLNESDDGPVKAGTMTRFDFANGFDHQPTAVSEFASGGFRGDLLQVGIDGCIYGTQGRLFSEGRDASATRYDNYVVDDKNGIVQICGGFAPAPGASAHNETATGTISGTVYVDLNENKQFDAGEPTLSGVTVTLNGPNGVQTTTSGGDGTYTFGDLPAGGFAVSSPDTAQGLQLFTDSPLTFTLEANEQKSGVDFGYVPGTVSGYAYVDSNRNQTFDAGEAIIPNVTITLQLTTGGTAMTTTTGADGKYVFPYVPAGTYNDSAPAVADGKALFTPSPLPVTVAAGQDSPNNNFGYVPGSITGTVFTDTNHNGTQDSNEPGTPGVTVTGSNGQTTTTDSNGHFEFPDVPPGTYTITTPDTPPTTVTVTPGGSTDVPLAHAVGTLSGFTYVDSNRNHARDAGEPAVAGVTVTGPGGATTTTAADGSYSFVNLEAGTYSVSAPATANSMALFTPSPLGVNVTAGQDSPNNNFGYVPGSITGTVFTDTNNNGTQDSGEPGIPGVTVTGPNGQTTTTDSTGHFEFPDVPGGTYTVDTPVTPPSTVTVPPGGTTTVNLPHAVGSLSGFAYVDSNRNMSKDAGEPGISGVTISGPNGATRTTAADGSYSFANLDPATYSVGAPGTASNKARFTPSPLSVTVTAGQDSANNNFGYVPGGLSGFAYVDSNRNGSKDAGETGIGGVLITVGGGPGGYYNGSATTAADGSYSIVNLDAGSYTAASPSTAAGKARSTTSPLSINVPAGGTSPNNNFGYVPGSLSGFAYFDANRSGTKDAGELGMGGITVTGPGGATTVTSFTDGSYSFQNLDAGTYSVSAPSVASGKALFTPSPLSVTVAAGGSSPNNNFGYVTGSISGYAYVDSNHNMVKDTGEAVLSNVTITLSGVTTTTGANGSYTFNNLIGATYSDSAPASVTGYTLGTPSPISVVLAAGEQRQNVNFGYVPVGGAMVTYTQGGWGAVPNGNNPGMLLKNNFATVYPSGVTIGGSPYYLKFTSAAAIEAFLPAGGKPGVLKASATNPLTSAANVFAGQVLAMQLSVDFSARGLTTPGLGGMHIAPGQPLAGYTVTQVMTLANQVIAGNLSALPAGMTVSNLNDLVTAMTQNFDNGSSNNGIIVQ